MTMRYTKNRRSVSYLDDKCSYEKLYKRQLKLINMHSLETTIYVVINQKNKDHLKSNAIKKILIEYDDDTIYKVYLSATQKIERVKDLDFYDNKSESKQITEFDELEETLVIIIDDEITQNTIVSDSQIVSSVNRSRKEVIIEDEVIQNITVSDFQIVSSVNRSRKAEKTELNHSSSAQSQKESQKISQKLFTMRFERQATQENFSMIFSAYAFIFFVESVMFHLAMRELLAN